MTAQTPPNVSEKDLKGSKCFLATVSQSKAQEYLQEYKIPNTQQGKIYNVWHPI